LTGWPDRVRTMQRNWIGESEGCEMAFALENGESLRIFTTRPDTLFGVTYMAVAPEHPLATTLCRGKPQEGEVLEFIEKCRKQNKIARTAEDAPKEGVATGSFALHPLTGERVPVYVANFVLMDYGTGALMAVPAHDVRDHAFARKYGIPIREVIRPRENADAKPVSEAAFTESGVLVNSPGFDGIESELAKKRITDALEAQGKGKKAVTFRLRDWGLSRQRYWGTPIPMIYCNRCGTVPVPEKDLPVLLPKDVEFTGEGGSPLAHHPDFLKTKCPKCGDGSARRETDTMDTFMESSWYYLRYLSPKEDSRPFNPEDLSYWLGVDQYIGGIEHATMHLLYFS
jgi:leucyl-tRNA synthetase